MELVLFLFFYGSSSIAVTWTIILKLLFKFSGLS